MKYEVSSSSTRKLFISRDEVATILGISLSSVDRGMKVKAPPFDKALRIGRRVLFPVSCIENMVTLEHRDE